MNTMIPTPTPALTPAPNPAGHKKFRMLLFAVGGLLVIASLVAIWAMSTNQKAEAACVVGEPGQAYPTAPTVNHMYAGETLSYYLRPDGNYVPIDYDVPKTTNAHEYTLRVEFDEPMVNPKVGSVLTGRLQLLEDGNPVTAPPKDNAGKLVFGSQLSVPVYVSGSLVPQLPNGPVGPTWKDLNVYNNSKDGRSRIPVLNYHIPYPMTYLYSDKAIVDGLGQIDISDGSAEFAFHYSGFRFAPYLQFAFGNIGHTQPENPRAYATGFGVAKTLCFSDQATPNLGPLKDLAAQSKQGFYYEVKSSPAEYIDGKPGRVRLDITARDERTNKVNANALQRVEIWAWPRTEVKTQRDNLRSGQPYPVADPQARGEFLLDAGDSPKVQQAAILQASNHQENQPQGYGTVSNKSRLFTDLINGKGTAYFQFDGVTDGVNTPLVFIVKPANFEVKALDEQKLTGSNRAIKNITIPPKPATVTGETESARLRTGDLTNVPIKDFLYNTWQNGEAVQKAVYTTHVIQIGTRPFSFIWLIVFILLALAGAGVAYYFFKNKKSHGLK